MITVFNISFQTSPHVEPLGSEQIVDILKNNGYESHLITTSLDGNIDDTTLYRVMLSKYIIFAGVNNVRDILDQSCSKRDEIIKKLKTFGYCGKIIVMGHQASLTPDDTIKNCSEIDAVIVGDTDIATNHLLNLINEGKHIGGVLRPERPHTDDWNKNGLIGTTKHRPYLSRLCDLHPREMLCATIESSRGCSHGGCSFCSTASLKKACNRSKYIVKPIEMIGDEMKYIFDEFGVNKFIIEDDLATPSNEFGFSRLEQFSRMIKTLGFNAEYSLVLRADCITTKTKSLFTNLRDNGLKLLYLGIESFNEDDLRLYGKNIQLSAMIEGIDIAQELGYQMDVSGEYRIKPGLMPFHPYTNLEAIRNQSKYLYKYAITPVKMIAEVELYPGTPLYQKAANDGLLAPGTRSGFNYQCEKTTAFHFYSKEMLKSFHKLRKRIRNIEKTIYGFGLDIDDTMVIRTIRRDLEEMFGEYYLLLLDECIEGATKQKLDELLDHFNKKIIFYTCESDADNKVDNAWNKTIGLLQQWYENIDTHTNPIFFRPCYFPVVH